jgi:hypothetical protein
MDEWRNDMRDNVSPATLQRQLTDQERRVCELVEGKQKLEKEVQALNVGNNGLKGKIWRWVNDYKVLKDGYDALCMEF